MGLEALEQSHNSPKPCEVSQILSQLPENKREILLRLIGSKTSVAAIREALLDEGHKIAEQPFTRHRYKKCGCEQ